MKNRPIKPIFIRLQPDYYLLGLLIVVSSAALWAVIFYVPIIWLKVSLSVLVLASSFYVSLRDALLRLPTSWKTLEVTSHGELIVCNLRGQSFKPQLAATSFVSAQLLVLNFVEGDNGTTNAENKSSAKSLSIIKQMCLFNGIKPLILLSAKPADELRKLRVWLRWWPHARQHQTADSLDALEKAS